MPRDVSRGGVAALDSYQILLCVGNAVELQLETVHLEQADSCKRLVVVVNRRGFVVAGYFNLVFSGGLGRKIVVVLQRAGSKGSFRRVVRLGYRHAITHVYAHAVPDRAVFVHRHRGSVALKHRKQRYVLRKHLSRIARGKLAFVLEIAHPPAEKLFSVRRRRRRQIGENAALVCGARSDRRGRADEFNREYFLYLIHETCVNRRVLHDFLGKIKRGRKVAVLVPTDKNLPRFRRLRRHTCGAVVVYRLRGDLTAPVCIESHRVRVDSPCSRKSYVSRNRVRSENKLGSVRLNPFFKGIAGSCRSIRLLDSAVAFHLDAADRASAVAVKRHCKRF